MTIRRGAFHPKELQLLPLAETWVHVIHLMQLANMGVPQARKMAQITMDRYFERIDEAM